VSTTSLTSTAESADAASLALSSLDPAVAQQIDQTVNAYVKDLAALDPRSREFTLKVEAIHTLGSNDIRESANLTNRLLQRPMKAMGSGALSKAGTVSRSLVELRRTVEDLDPSRQAGLTSNRLLRKLPFGYRLRDYFGRYQSAQGHLNAIIQALYRGQDELRHDNAAMEQEKVNIRSVKGRLERYAYMAARLDAALESEIDRVAISEPERARTLREELLFYVRQKRQDLLTQLAVNTQGFLALELMRKNNLELIKGVDRATTSTVAALRTAVIVAQALVNQKLVLSQISALTGTTGQLIESTSELLRDQSAQVHDQAVGATVGIEKLRAAFSNVYRAIDHVDSYKLEAVQAMQTTIEALSAEIGRAQRYLERAEAQPAAVTAGSEPSDLALSAGPRS
jgi:uncharacterized protein YaaN involved in tellurite resistance